MCCVKYRRPRSGRRVCLPAMVASMMTLLTFDTFAHPDCKMGARLRNLNVAFAFLRNVVTRKSRKYLTV